MLTTHLRRCNHFRHINGVVGTGQIGHVVTSLGNIRCLSKDKSCCPDTPQAEGKKVEAWPKPDPPPPAWRCECPKEPQPPNYDPYRIKVPDVVVPPIPSSNAKWTGVVFTVDQQGKDPPAASQEPAAEQREAAAPGPGATEQLEEEEPPSEGFFTRIKNMFGFGKRRKGEGDMSFVGKKPMLECARLKGPCSVQPAPAPPPCPPPPPKPFPWIYVWSVTSFFAIMGMIYQLYVWKEAKEKLGESIPIWRPRRKIKRPYHCKDLPPCVQYLIVGTGAAGWAAYNAIMEHDKTAKVFFITKEDCLPYDRPPMSKHMWWNPDPPDLTNLNYIEDGKRHTMYLSECRHFMDPIKFYRKRTGPAVSVASGWCVLRVDADDHVVWVKTMCGEQPIYYERCLLAPGSKPKKLSVFKSAPKAVRDKVCSLRTIRDLEIAYRKVKAAKHVVIIGGGALGCELAWHLGKMNQLIERPDDEEPTKFVHMFKDRGILASILPEYLGEWAAEKIKCEGVTMMPKTQVYDAFETPDGRLELTLSNGTSVITDYVFVAVGNEPRIELAEPSFLELDRVNGGFKVNTELEARTHLYVAGDAASFYSQWKDTRLRVEHYSVAAAQGTVAGANMTGYWTPCNMEPHFWLRLGTALEMQVVGEVGACMPTVGLFKQCSDDTTSKQAEAGGGDRPCYKKSEEYQNRYKRGILFYLRDETVVGMVLWNIPPVDDRRDVVTEMLRAKPTYKDIDMLAGLLGFPDTKCVYESAEELKEPGPCIKNRRVF